MNDEPPRPFPTWQEFSAVQSGRWFFVKWMACACAVGIAVTAFNAARMRMPHPESLLSFALGLAQGWPLFGWRWRTWVWSAVWVAALSLPVLMPHWMFFGLGTVQALLLLGCRRRFLLWLGISQAGWEVYWGVMHAGPKYLEGWISTLRFLLRTPSWIQAHMMAVGLGLSIYFMILGTALAWWMPPVTTVTTPPEVR